MPEVFLDDYNNLGSRNNISSDLLKFKLHRKSIISSYSAEANNPLTPCNFFSEGEQIFSEVRDELEDSVRVMAENCDQLQGFHLLFQAHDGFSGAGISMLHQFCDNFHGKPIFSFPISPVENHCSENILINLVLTLADIYNSKYLSCFLNLSQQWYPSYLSHKWNDMIFEPDSMHHNFLLGLAMDIATLGYRLYQSQYSLAECSQFLQGSLGALTLAFFDKFDNLKSEATLLPNYGRFSYKHLLGFANFHGSLLQNTSKWLDELMISCPNLQFNIISQPFTISSQVNYSNVMSYKHSLMCLGLVTGSYNIGLSLQSLYDLATTSKVAKNLCAKNVISQDDWFGAIESLLLMRDFYFDTYDKYE